MIRIRLRSVVGSALLPPDIPLLGNGELDTLALGQGHPWLVALADNEDVGDTGGESPVEGVLDVNDIESTDVLLPVHNRTRTAHVTSTSDHDDVASVKLDKVDDLVLLEVELDSVVDLDSRVRVTDSAAVVGDDMGDTLVSEGGLLYLEELVGGFLGGDAVNGESSLYVVEDSEVLAGLLDGDNIHEPGRVGVIGANFVIDLDQTLLDDFGDLSSVESVF